MDGAGVKQVVGEDTPLPSGFFPAPASCLFITVHAFITVQK